MARGISPETNGGASLGSSAKNWANLFTQNITLSNNFDLMGSAIVAKSIGENNGYIKYVSGLIIQWGVTASSTNGVTKTLPISFTSNSRYSLAVCPEYTSIVNYVVFDKTANSFIVKNDIGSIAFDFIAIGF